MTAQLWSLAGFLLVVLIALIVLFVIGAMKGTAGTIQSGEHGVAYLFGKVREKDIKPGIFFRLPWVYTVERVSVAEQPLLVNPVQTFMEGNMPVTVEFALRARVDKAWKFQTKAEDGMASVVQQADPVALRHIKGKGVEVLTSSVEATKVNEAMMADLHAQVSEEVGVAVVRFAIANHSMSDAAMAIATQEQDAERDAKADMVRAKNELPLADRYMAAARKYHGDNAPLTVLAATALQLRFYGTLDDLNSGVSVLLPTGQPNNRSSTVDLPPAPLPRRRIGEGRADRLPPLSSGDNDETAGP